MNDPKTIWLQPWCADCEGSYRSDEGRLWCEEDTWGQCFDCGVMPVKYILAPDQPQKPESEADGD
jgi:hypothetical protein